MVYPSSAGSHMLGLQHAAIAYGFGEQLGHVVATETRHYEQAPSDWRKERIPVLMSTSIQLGRYQPYGLMCSKRAGEKRITAGLSGPVSQPTSLQNKNSVLAKPIPQYTRTSDNPPYR